MKSMILFVQILLFYRLGVCQDINELKYSALEEIVQLIKNVEAKQGEMDTKLEGLLKKSATQEQMMIIQQSLSEEMDTKLVGLESLLKKSATQEQVITIQQSLSEGELCGSSSNEDLLIDTLSSIIDGQKELQKEILQNTCNTKQIEILQDLIATDECLENTHNCSHVCEDTILGFRCHCPNGYYGDGIDCQDIDECLPGTTNNCSRDGGNCTNTEGTYECSCRSGFFGDGVTCTDCPSNFMLVEDVGCMHVGPTTSNQANGKIYCAGLHEKGMLIVPDNFESLRLFIRNSPKYNTKSFYWVGVENKRWLNGDPVLEEQTKSGVDSSGSMKCGYLHKTYDYRMEGNSCGFDFMKTICGLSP